MRKVVGLTLDEVVYSPSDFVSGEVDVDLFLMHLRKSGVEIARR